MNEEEFRKGPQIEPPPAASCEKFQMFLHYRNGSVEVGDAFKTENECQVLAEKILAAEKDLIRIDVTHVIATFEKEFRVVKTR